MMFKGVPSTLVVEELLHNELRRADAAGELSSNVVRPAAMLAACRNRVSTCYQHNSAGNNRSASFSLARCSGAPLQRAWERADAAGELPSNVICPVETVKQQGINSRAV
jgi:hypothetical protein